jgi:uncharacterized protein involved in exopolysaccharide biosynthesis
MTGGLIVSFPGGVIVTYTARLLSNPRSRWVLMILLGRLRDRSRLWLLVLVLVTVVRLAGGAQLRVVLIGHAGQLLDQGDRRP